MTAFDPRDGTADPLRISDAERNDAAERLNQSFSEGRLNLDEFSSRLDEVYAARTDVELDGAFRGLPRPSPPPPPRDSRQWDWQARVRRIVGTSTPAIICTAIWGMTGHGYFWPEWVWFGAGVAALGGLRGHRRHHELGPNGVEAARLPPGPVVPGRRLVLTAVFVDIVGSTEKAAALGDRRWRELVGRFEQQVDLQLLAHHGRKLFTKGDEVVTTFRSPGDAIRFACALRGAIRPLELEVRSGIHTGEVEGRKSDLSGITLHVGQRVSATAAPGEVLVSSTVRDLALGSGIVFTDRGEHELRGLPGTWHLYAVGLGDDPV